jgi:uncharacterized RDD family membrane protein YckC
MRYAGFNARSGAYTIDGLIVIALTYVVYYVTGGDAKAQDLTEILQQLQANPEQVEALDYFGILDMLSEGPSLMLATIVSAVYNIGFVASRWQATPGKHWRGMHITMNDGSRPGLIAATVRHAASGLSTVLLFIGFMMVGWTKEKTALHDIIADTRVVYHEEVA